MTTMPRQLLTAAMLGASLVLVASAQEPLTDTRPAHDKALRSIAAAVSSSRISADVREICQFGPRLAGSASARAAAAWAEARLKSLGITDVSPRSGPVVSVSEPGTAVLDVRGDDGVPLGLVSAMARPGSPGIEVVDLPLVTPESPPVPGQLAWFGATGARLPSGCVLVVEPADCCAPDVTPLDPVETTIATLSISMADAARLRAAMARDPRRRVHATVTVRASLGAITGVRAVAKSAAGDPGICLVACLATRSGGPGADESAAGVAALMEVARVVMAAPELWSTSIRFELSGDWGPRGAPPAEDLPDGCIVLGFGRLGLGALHDCLFVLPESLDPFAPAGRAVGSILAGYAGKRGFWPEFAMPAGRETAPWFEGARGARAGVFLTAHFGRSVHSAESRAVPGGKVETPVRTILTDECPVSGTSGDVPERTVALEPANATGAARLALMFLADRAERLRGR